MERRNVRNLDFDGMHKNWMVFRHHPGEGINGVEKDEGEQFRKRAVTRDLDPSNHKKKMFCYYIAHF